MFEMLAGRSPFDIVGLTDNPEQHSEDYLFQGSATPCVAYLRLLIVLHVQHTLTRL